MTRTQMWRQIVTKGTIYMYNKLKLKFNGGIIILVKVRAYAEPQIYAELTAKP